MAGSPAPGKGADGRASELTEERRSWGRLEGKGCGRLGTWAQGESTENWAIPTTPSASSTTPGAALTPSNRRENLEQLWSKFRRTSERAVGSSDAGVWAGPGEGRGRARGGANSNGAELEGRG